MASTAPPHHSPSKPEPKTILITGINGYIASTLGLHLLQAGHTVRGTSRSPHHESTLRSGPYAAFPTTFEYYHVPDITAPGAFDTAVVGCHAILPLAAPVSAEGNAGLAAFLEPGLKSVTSLMESTMSKAGQQLESVVYMSSVAAVWDFGKGTAEPDYVFSEADWNEFSERTAREVEAGGGKAPWFLAYPASKNAAEQLVWDFKDEKKPPFSISAILPGYVFGPPAHIPRSTDPDALTPTTVTESLRIAFQLFTGALKAPILGPVSIDPAAGPFVDIRDICTMFEWCLTHPKEADNERFLACVGMTCSQVIADVLRDAYPERGIGGAETKGSEEAFVKVPGWKEGFSRFSLRKCEETMGIRFRGFEESLLDAARAFEKAGY